MGNLTESKKIPELRFPGFTGEWEEKKLGEVGEFYNGLKGKNKDYFVNGNKKYISYLSIFSNTIINKDFSDFEYVIIEKGEAQNIVKYGDVLFTQSSETIEEVGMSSVYLNKEETYLNSFSFGYRFNKSIKMDYMFTGYMFRSESIRKRIITEGQGSTRFNLSSNRLKNISIPFPSLAEQEKIGSFFSSLDKKLDLQKDRLEGLKSYKKGMMQRIFSQEIRFKDENGQDYPDWEEKKLGEVAEIKTGNTPPTKDIDNYGEEYLFVSPGDLGRKKYINATEKMLSNKGYSISRKFDKSSILFTCIGSTIGKLGIAGKDLTSNQQINAILPNNNYNSEYLYYSLDFLSSRIKLLASNQAVPIINKSEFEKIKIYLPSLPEQEKIAYFLSALDRSIELEEERLEVYEKLKKGLMQRMFV